MSPLASGSCRVCGTDTTTDHGRCTNGCCSRCHEACCTPGGDTTPGHALPRAAVELFRAQLAAKGGR